VRNKEENLVRTLNSIKRMPVLSIRHLPLRIPNVHSTSFLINSSHDENRSSVQLLVVLIGGNVVGQAKYPLLTKSHAPWYLRVVTMFGIGMSISSTAAAVDSYKSKNMSSIMMPSFKSVMKLSNKAKVLSFQRAGCPDAVARIYRRWLTVIL
jgi:hypothetical protein